MNVGKVSYQPMFGCKDGCKDCGCKDTNSLAGPSGFSDGFITNVGTEPKNPALDAIREKLPPATKPLISRPNDPQALQDYFERGFQK